MAWQSPGLSDCLPAATKKQNPGTRRMWGSEATLFFWSSTCTFLKEPDTHKPFSAPYPKLQYHPKGIQERKNPGKASAFQIVNACFLSPTLLEMLGALRL